MLIPGTPKAKDTVLLARFTEWYCKAHHGDRPRIELDSKGVASGIYRKKAPVLCDECAEYVRYAEARSDACPLDPKPFCSTCTVSCYNQKMTQYSRQVMRYSGPRSILSRYFFQAIRHANAMRKMKKLEEQ